MPDKKHLILTYGVSEGRRRTVILPLPRVNALLAALALMAAWTVGSMGYMLFTGFRTEAVAVATASEPVRVLTEPEVAEQEPVREEMPELAPNAAVEPAPELETAAPAATSESAAAATQVAETAATDADVEPSSELAAELENYRVDETIGKLVARFSVRNLSAATLRGKIRGEAEFVALDGSVHTIAAEQAYKAKSLSAKELLFSAPTAGKFTKVKITVDDQATHRAKVFFK